MKLLFAGLEGIFMGLIYGIEAAMFWGGVMEVTLVECLHYSFDFPQHSTGKNRVFAKRQTAVTHHLRVL
jgi:hypothetical protein